MSVGYSRVEWNSAFNDVSRLTNPVFTAIPACPGDDILPQAPPIQAFLFLCC